MPPAPIPRSSPRGCSPPTSTRAQAHPRRDPKADPARDFVGAREGDDFYLDIASEGAGTFQPIFHIDMFVTLVAPARRRLRALVEARGSPTSGSGLESLRLDDVYDTIAAEFTAWALR